MVLDKNKNSSNIFTFLIKEGFEWQKNARQKGVHTLRDRDQKTFKCKNELEIKNFPG